MRRTRPFAARRRSALALAWRLLWFLVACGGAALVGQAPSTRLRLPTAVAYDAAGNLYLADANRHQVLEATLAGALVVVAGTGTQGYSGDGGPAASAQLNSPQGLAFGADGSLYIADTGNARIRVVNGGVIATFAGSGASGFGGDGGPASAAKFRSPAALAFDASGNLLICDTADQRVRRVSGGVVSTFAGDGTQGFGGDGGLATAAELDSPMGLAVGSDGRVFLADTHNNRVRVVGVDGVISTFAGTGDDGFAGDGGPAAAARLWGPRALAVTGAGELLVADANNRRVRSISSAGVITTVVGTGAEGASADGSPAMSSALRSPRGVAVSTFGMATVVDALSGAVRLVTSSGALYQPAAFASGRSSALQPVVSASQMYGQGSASVAVTGAVGVPQGLVTLTEGGSAVASAGLSGGSAAVDLSSLSAGGHSLTANYAGDGLNPAASATISPITVQPAAVVAAAAGASVAYGAALPALSGTLTGVLPQDSGQVQAVFAAGVPSQPGVGSYPITATLSGAKAGNYTVSVAPNSGLLRVTQAGTGTTLGGVAQSYTGLPLRLTATVASTTTGSPTGTVQFLDGGVVVASAAVVNGSASAVYVSPPAGTRSLTAQYGGDANFVGSGSAVEEAVITALPDFGVSAAGAGTATVAAGNPATYGLAIKATSGPFTGVVVLSASGLPAGATASFSPVQVVPGAGSATVTMTVQTPLPTAFLRPVGGVDGVLWASGLVCLVGATRRRRRLLLLGAALVLSGCGARTVGEGSSGLTSQTYTVQVTGTSTNLVGSVVTHTANVSLIVQQ